MRLPAWHIVHPRTLFNGPDKIRLLRHAAMFGRMIPVFSKETSSTCLSVKGLLHDVLSFAEAEWTLPLENCERQRKFFVMILSVVMCFGIY